MKFLTVLIASLLITVLSSADTFSFDGRIIEYQQKKYISWDGSLYHIFSREFGISSELTRLKPGDYLSFTGSFLESSAAIQINSIRYVGLAGILGVWRTLDWNIFEFRNFTRLNLYIAKTVPQTIPAIHNTMFGYRPVGYSLSPHEQQNTWTMLMVDQEAVQVGRLVFSQPNSIQIKILDQSSGVVTHTITLYPLYDN